ncbi:hypothetical protein JW933_05185 [candidate division FCPU426 bacterium]|nr:hypothetical protein [candidate division FCPU426 bacterium]
MKDNRRKKFTAGGSFANAPGDTPQEQGFDGLPPAYQRLLIEYQDQIRQLQDEITSYRAERDRVMSDNVKQNEMLREINASLDQKIKDRTCELEASKEQLAVHNQEMRELAKSKEEMMHMIVHDMKNPLTAIMGALALSQHARFGMDEEMRDLLKSANIHSIKLRAMIDDILTMSKMQSRELELQKMEVDLVSLIQQSVFMMNTTMGNRKLTLKFEPAQQECLVEIDFQMIERVINNVINNAMKYAPDGSEILLELTREEKFACLHIKNWGEPIAKEFHKKIFEMYGRANPQDKRVEGTGLGLAFCKLAVEAHGGRIRIESPIPPGEIGAHFYFTLPLHLAPEK